MEILDSIRMSVKKTINFIGFAKGFFIRRNPIKMFIDSIVNSLKEMLTVKQKLKMAQYRVNYHKHQLHKMESLIAENNEHTFLRGKNLNETR